ncbi:WG repeat-containing protein [Flavobacterium sp. TMP13]|uniref:WG repeat-containing protein n=1 Tax=Flavobacterium sp. TMP13 TaxID=3425950 RepID=UPI003D77B934
MKFKIFLFLTLLLSTISYSQQKSDWIRVENYDGSKIGYKDINGNVKIAVDLETTFAPPKYFNHIIPIFDLNNHNYYLLKNKQKIALDSVYISSDYELDCERENKIRFRDKKSRKIGFLNQNGNVIIPALYNYAAPFYNNLAVVLKNATRTCLEQGVDSLNCEHPIFKGGITQLINDKNQLVVDSIDTAIATNLNWYSLHVSATNKEQINRVSFKGVNGDFYSFIDYDKEFKNWFFNTFVPVVNQRSIKQLEKLSFIELTTWSENEQIWKNNKNSEVINSEFVEKLVSKAQFLLENPKNSFFNSSDLNPYIYQNKNYDEFYDCNGNLFKEKYPAYSFYINYVDANQSLEYQESIAFIKTEKGYKLFTYSFKN